MAVILWDFVVELEDGTEHKVVADQRDLARWEMEPFGSSFALAETKPVVFSRYLAWRAMHRAKLFTAGWERFQDECVEVRENSAQAGDQVDPGQAAPPDAP